MDEMVELCKQQGINLESISEETLQQMLKHFKLGYEMAAELDKNDITRGEFENLKNEVEQLKSDLKKLLDKENE